MDGSESGNEVSALVIAGMVHKKQGKDLENAGIDGIGNGIGRCSLELPGSWVFPSYSIIKGPTSFS